MKKIILGALIVIIAISCIFYYNYTNSPKYTLIKVQNAIVNEDYFTLKTYVDTESFLNNIVDDFVSVKLEDEDGVASAFAAKMMEGIKPQLVKKTETYLEKVITNSKESSNIKEKDTILGMFNYFQGIESVEFMGVDNEKKNNNEALVTINFQVISDYGNHKLPVNISLKNDNDLWIISKVDNFGDLISDIEKIQNTIIDSINVSVKNRINSEISVGNTYTTYTLEDSWSDENFEVKIDFINTSKKHLKGIIFDFYGKDDEGNILFSKNNIEEYFIDVVEPADTVQVVLNTNDLDINFFSQEFDNLMTYIRSTKGIFNPYLDVNAIYLSSETLEVQKPYMFMKE